METKPFYKSKTFWFNVASIVQLTLPLLGIPAIPMDADTTGVIMGVGNVILRSVTSGGITLKSKE